jgi:hypothetical protein
MGRYVSQPLIVKCESVHDIRQFLAGCKYVSDKDLFNKEEYWQPPEEFEQRKKGDCEDFAFWTCVNCSRWDTTFASFSGGTDGTERDTRG